MQRAKIVNVMALAALIGLMPITARAAKDDDLRAQVKALNERIAQLEKQLSQQAAQESAAAPALPPAGVPVAAAAADDWEGPSGEMQRMQAFMNRLLESFDQGFSLGRANLLGPQADIQQTAGQYIVTMDLPGMEKSNINVEVKNGVLVVSGERNAQQEVSQPGQFYRQERSMGQFLRTLPLPDDAKTDDIKADYKNGVLEIKIGRSSGGKPVNEKGQKIQVN